VPWPLRSPARLTRCMFVEAAAPVPIPLRAAQRAFAEALAHDRLARQSVEAYSEGLEALRRVGPPGLGKQVRVQTLTPRHSNDTTLVAIRWEATGVGGQLFPVLDADLALTSVNDVTSLLSVVGRYAPPFGGLGRALDRTLLAGAAQATVDDFVRELGRSICQVAASQRAEPSPLAAARGTQLFRMG
jgi:hypothetical protein